MPLRKAADPQRVVNAWLTRERGAPKNVWTQHAAGNREELLNAESPEVGEGTVD